MKKPLFVLFSMLIGLACKNDVKPGSDDGTPAKTSRKTVVYVSNYPLYYFAQRIGGSALDLRFPAGNAENPSDWMPSAEEVSAMQDADLILLNGATYEGWLMNVSLPDSLMIDTSVDFTSRLLPSGATFTHSHGADGEHSHEGVASKTWLDLELAAKQAEATSRSLMRKSPDQAELYKANTETLVGELLELDREYKALSENGSFPKTAFSKPIFQYLAHGYGLEGPSLGWESDVALDHDKLHEIGHLRKDPGIQVLIWADRPQEVTVNKLKESGIQSVILNPLDTQPESGDFLTGMLSNLQALKSVIPQG